MDKHKNTEANTRNHKNSGVSIREPITPEEREKLLKNKPKRGCWCCMFYLRDMMLWARTLVSGFPIAGMCANHPDTPGRLRPVSGPACRNFRAKPFRVTPPDPPNDTVRYIPLTRGMCTLVDAADYEWLSQYKWQVAPAATGTSYYAKRVYHKRLILMHREIMNPPKGKFVDHINGNGLDNRRCNLRICDAQENCCNRSKIRGAAYKYIGVYPTGKNTYKAAVMYKGKTYRAGPFPDEVEAAKARDRLALKHHGPFAHLNFPPEEPEAEGQQPSD